MMEEAIKPNITTFWNVMPCVSRVGVEEAIKPNNTMEMDAYLFSMSGLIGLSIGRCHMLKARMSGTCSVDLKPITLANARA